MKKRILNVNHEIFTVVRPQYKNRPDFESCKKYDTLNLDNYYKSYSYKKKNVYNYWLEWSKEVNDLMSFGVSSANTNLFTITGTYIDGFGQKWVLYITPYHKKAILAK